VPAIDSRLTRLSSTLEREPQSWAGVVIFVLLCIAAGAIFLVNPETPRRTLAVLLAIGMSGAVTLLFLLRRQGRTHQQSGRAAAAASAQNVAWAVTGSDGCIIDCNEAYRTLVRREGSDAPDPPQLAFRSDSAAGPLYRLLRAAHDRQAHQEAFDTTPSRSLSAAVSPLKKGETAWWFISRERTPRTVGWPGSVVARAALGDVFADAPIGVAVVTDDGSIAHDNAAFREFFGGSGDLTEAADFRPLMEAGAREAASDMIARALNGERSADPVEILCQLRPNTPRRSGQLFASPLAAAPGEKSRAILYLVDTTQQRALETQFAQSQKMQAIGQLAGGVAHDFNNLLQAILGNCDLLMMRHPVGDPSFAELNEVRQNSVRAAALVRQLLAFSRQQALQPKVIVLSEMVTDLSLLLRRLVGERITLQVVHGSDLWPVHADEGQLANAIINLVVNSRDAMPSVGGTVTIRTANVTHEYAQVLVTGKIPPGDYAVIEIADTGCGIPKENLEKVFEPFFTTKPVGHGTGLGLSTVYGVVKQTGGFINVASETGAGTVFSIYLPRYVGPITVDVSVDEIEKLGTRDITGQETILLVEDDEAVRSFAARALKMRGYTVLEAATGEAALELVQDYPAVIHLLVTDVVMPNMDGPTLVRAVMRQQPAIQVIYMSGYAEDVFRRGGERAEDVHFLPKPFGIKQFVAKVKEVLSGASPTHQPPIEVQAVAAVLADPAAGAE
jgi:two-component system, cell cycle sensor histidine kinase and response regulator CckA